MSVDISQIAAGWHAIIQYILGRENKPSLIFVVKGGGWFVSWEWTDWVGLGILIIVIGVFIAGIVALARGAQPLKVMREFGGALKTLARTAPKPGKPDHPPPN